MTYKAHLTGLICLATTLLAGCAGSVAVRVDQEFPDVVAEPMDMSVALVMEPAFQSYVATPNENTTIQIGSAQVKLLSKAFRGLFRDVTVVSAKHEVGSQTDLVITPSVREVQVSTPSESYLNVFEVWIKYNLDIETADGVPIDSWFLPAYGKTPSSALLSKSTAIQDATIVALRDAGAKLMLDFFRIPAIYGWMQQREAVVAGS